MTATSTLTETHRQAQLSLGRLVVLQLHAAFKLLDPHALDATFAGWLAIVLALIKTHRATSSSLAAAYLAAFRALQVGVDTTFPAVLAPAVDDVAVATSMLVTGPVSIKTALARKVELFTAVDIAEARSSAAGMRHVLNAGRDTVVATIEADPKALGFARVASDHACAFCAMLASRGPVYKSEQTATFAKDGHRYHDGCQCGIEPHYSPDDEWPETSRSYQQQWQATTRGLSGTDALNAFRRSLAR